MPDAPEITLEADELIGIVRRMRESYAQPETDGRTNRAVVRAFDLALEQFNYAVEAHRARQQGGEPA